jgi:acetyl esterase/lipase
VILPGGGYGSLSPYERLYAEFFRSLGYGAAVVDYRVGPNPYPAAYADGLRALRLVRRHGAEWGLASRRIVLLGASAGGHLAALVATRPDFYRDPQDELAGQVSARPDGLILLYPVISAVAPYRHAASFSHWFGPEASEALRSAVSPELHVTRDNPPAIIFHAADDPVVPVENSLVFARACWRAGVPAELHVFPRGGHGFRFAYDAEVSPRWRDLVRQWLEIQQG